MISFLAFGMFDSLMQYQFSVYELSLYVYRIQTIFEYSYVANSGIVSTMFPI